MTTNQPIHCEEDYVSHVHQVVVASAYEFCRGCGRVWDDEFPDEHYMTSEELADELGRKHEQVS